MAGTAQRGSSGSLLGIFVLGILAAVIAPFPRIRTATAYRARARGCVTAEREATPHVILARTARWKTKLVQKPVDMLGP